MKCTPFRGGVNGDMHCLLLNFVQDKFMCMSRGILISMDVINHISSGLVHLLLFKSQVKMFILLGLSENLQYLRPFHSGYKMEFLCFCAQPLGLVSGFLSRLGLLHL